MQERESGVGENREKNYVDLVFEGGGVKGIGLVGALSVLTERGYEPQNVAGASAGAIVAVLLAAGYEAAELREIIGTLDLARFKDKSWEDRIPLIGKELSILEDRGIYKGEAFFRWMRDLLEAKGVRTFKELIRNENDEPRYRYKVAVIASDLSEGRLLVLPEDAEKLGISDPDDLDVALAVRMSMSIPIFFEPVRWHNPKTGREHLIVDGGMLSNFPVWLFDSEGEPEWPTFGLKLIEDLKKTSLVKKNPSQPEVSRGSTSPTLIGYLKSLVDTMMEAHDRLYIEEHDFARTVAIDTLGVRTTQFDLSRDKATELYESGRKAAQKFLNGAWDFGAYVKTFRSGPEPSRREAIAALHQEAAVAEQRAAAEQSV